jgi:hypothetical protein
MRIRLYFRHLGCLTHSMVLRRGWLGSWFRHIQHKGLFLLRDWQEEPASILLKAMAFLKMRRFGGWGGKGRGYS